MASSYRRLFVCWAFAVAVGSAGCGSDESSPTPTTVATPTPNPAPTPALGSARIQGYVDGGETASSRGVAAQAGLEGIKVTVVGTTVATTSDNRGAFALSGLPAGTVTLRFQGTGIDAQIQVAGLVAGQTLVVDFEVKGGAARVVPPPTEVDFTAQVVSKDPFIIGTRRVETGDYTSIDRHGVTISWDQIALGDTAHVIGTVGKQNIVFAWQIHITAP